MPIGQGIHISLRLQSLVICVSPRYIFVLMTISFPLYFQYIVWCLLLAHKNIISQGMKSIWFYCYMDMSDSRVASLQFWLWKMVQLQINGFYCCYLEKKSCLIVFTDFRLLTQVSRNYLFFWGEGVGDTLITGRPIGGGSHITAIPVFIYTPW